MPTFTDRIRAVVGSQATHGWAKDNHLPPTKVWEWVTNGRTPHTAGMSELADKSGIPLEWWMHGDLPPPTPVKRQEPEAVSRRVEQPLADYVAIPLYNGVRAAAGNGAVVEHETPDDALVFKEQWVRVELGARPQDLYLIRVAGDSMEPTLRSGDVILVDRRATRPDREGVYIMRMNDMLLVKRLQALPGGKVRVISDNAAFTAFDLQTDDLEGGDVVIVGRVVWTGRRM
jgi:phage repressor protein C with HTH and peptisase S24 domain